MYHCQVLVSDVVPVFVELWTLVYAVEGSDFVRQPVAPRLGMLAYRVEAAGLVGTPFVCAEHAVYQRTNRPPRQEATVRGHPDAFLQTSCDAAGFSRCPCIWF